MDFILILGLFAAALTSFSGIPQLVKIIKAKSAKDLSLGMFIMLAIGSILWLTYGIITKGIPLIVANTITLAIVVSILVLKLRYK